MKGKTIVILMMISLFLIFGGVALWGVDARENLELNGRDFQLVAEENFDSEGGTFKVPAKMGRKAISWSLPTDYAFNRIRIRFKLGDHQPNIRLRCDNVDLLFLYEHDIRDAHYLQMKAQLFKTGEQGNSKALATHYFSNYSRAQKAHEFVNFDIIRRGDSLSIWIDEIEQVRFPNFNQFSSKIPGFFTTAPQFIFDRWWGLSRTQSGQPLEVDFVALYTTGEAQLILPISLIPEPKSFKQEVGFFTINHLTQVDGETEGAQSAVSYLTEVLFNSTGFSLTRGEAQTNSIRLVQNDGILNPEGYRLKVTADGVVIEAKQFGGFFYGVTTLLQLMHPGVWAPQSDLYQEQPFPLQIPACTIEDEPRFSYRGLLLDESRHFFGPKMVKQIIDEMAKVKMNRLHWHLTDDGGFRFPFSGTFIAKSGNVYDFDAFMQNTAWRGGENANFLGNWQFCTKEANYPDIHGGFYSKEEIKEIVAYAQKRNISIIPELDVPGHCKPLYDFFPTLRCDGKNTKSNPGKAKKPEGFKDLCPSSPDILELLDYMIGQIDELFPSDWIHVGADEVCINNLSWYDVGPWWFCERCKEQIQTLTNDASASTNYPNLQKLQAHFLKEVEKMVHKRNNKMIIWNEGMHGGFIPADPTKTYMWYWNGPADLKAAKERGVKTVNMDTNNYYIDMYQTTADAQMGLPAAQDWGGSAPIITLERIYNNNPTVDHNGQSLGKGQMGLQTCMWNEHTIPYTKNGRSFTREDKLRYMLFPRVQAVAERAWSPESKKDWRRFQEKMKIQYRRFEVAGVKNYCNYE